MSSPSIASLYPILLHGIRADVLVQLGPISVVVARAHGKLMRVYDRTDLDSLGLDAATVYERATKNLEARHSDGSIRVRRGRSPRGAATSGVSVLPAAVGDPDRGRGRPAGP